MVDVQINCFSAHFITTPFQLQLHHYGPSPAVAKVTSDVKLKGTPREEARPAPYKAYGFCGRYAPCLLTEEAAQVLRIGMEFHSNI